jgi:hypothetical protein
VALLRSQGGNAAATKEGGRDGSETADGGVEAGGEGLAWENE